MNLIFETENYIVEAEQAPLVTRLDGGHITISPKVQVRDRTQLSPMLAVELIYLTILIGRAMTLGLQKRGISIGRINYQDNGNWGVFKPEGPYLHVHLYGRAIDAKIHKYGEACSFPFRETGFYKGFESLTDEDITEIQKQIKDLQKKEKYTLSEWL